MLWTLKYSENVKGESAANLGACTGCEFGTNIRHRVIARRYPGAGVRTDKSCRGPTCEGSKRSMVREWDILVCRAEVMGDINQTLCYFRVVILLVNLSSQKGSCIMERQEANEVSTMPILTIVQ